LKEPPSSTAIKVPSFSSASGLAALRMLDAGGWFDLRCHLQLPMRVPHTCLLDGIQFSTGCTFGKCNIEVEKGEGVEVLFEKKDGGRLLIRVRPKTLELIEEALSRGEESRAIEHLIEAPDGELFTITRTQSPSMRL
jgi:hypothetical protein